LGGELIVPAALQAAQEKTRGVEFWVRNGQKECSRRTWVGDAVLPQPVADMATEIDAAPIEGQRSGGAALYTETREIEAMAGSRQKKLRQILGK